MNLLRIAEMPLGKRLEFVASRADWLRRILSYPTLLDSIFRHAWDVLQSEREGSRRWRIANTFLANLLRHIQSPLEVEGLCKALEAEHHETWMDFLVSSSATSVDLVAALVWDLDMYKRFPQEGAWRGHAIFVRGTMLMNDAPQRRFEIEELLPLGVEAEPGAGRALLGAAFDRDQLTQRASDALLQLFPGDPYLTAAVARRRGEVTPKGD